MTIQRQYSLPNCTLILEGLNETNGNGGQEARPLLSILMNAECYFVGQPTPLRGGRDFFESLVLTVSRYAQEFLSAVHVPALDSHQHKIADPLVQIQKVEGDRHRLIVRNAEASVPGQVGPIQLDLSTVQLFDLVEAIDQFFADTQTLPNLSCQLTPAHRRHATNQEPVAKRAVPLVLGASSLALTSVAFFFLPIPPVQRPEPSPKPATSGPTKQPTPAPASPGATPQNQSKSLPPEASPTPTATVATPTTPAVLAITDPAQLGPLSQRLYSKIDQVWKTRPSFQQNLVYRVSVSQDATIIGYKPVNAAALDYASQTPLLNLVAVPTSEKPASQGPLAQFKVVFTPRGVLEVSPWYGYPPGPQTSTAASNQSGGEITNAVQLEELSTTLYKEINTAWRARPTFDLDLVYQVKTTKDGAIASYEPINSAAVNYTQEVPLPGLAKGEPANSEPLARFRVVFKPSGVLQVSPWQGYPPQ